MDVTQGKMDMTQGKMDVTQGKMDATQGKMNVTQRDLILFNIKKQIDSKQQLLLKRHYELETEKRNNEFLDQILYDYQKYQSYILHQKRDQIKMMVYLKKYLQDLILSGKLTDEDIKKARREQNDILFEIEQINKGIEEIITNNFEISKK
jgi:phosphoribosylanthranilate isomerase